MSSTGRSGPAGTVPGTPSGGPRVPGTRGVSPGSGRPRGGAGPGCGGCQRKKDPDVGAPRSPDPGRTSFLRVQPRARDRGCACLAARAGLTHYSGFMAAAAARSVAPSRLCSASRSKMVAAPPQRPRPQRAGANAAGSGRAAKLLGTCSLLPLCEFSPSPTAQAPREGFFFFSLPHIPLATPRSPRIAFWDL